MAPQLPRSPKKRLFWDWLTGQASRGRSSTLQELSQLRFKERKGLSAEEKEAELRKLSRLIDQEEALQPQSAPPFGRRWQLAAAAILLLGLSYLVWFWVAQQRPLQYATGYGEMQRIALPDGSVVVLNASSHLEVPRHWDAEGAREVWLEGEAFFEVAEKPTAHGKAKFIVHTPDLHVEVLGTKFNVRQRSAGTKVVLNSGKVKLDLGTQAAPIYMKPGDMVEYSEPTRQLVRTSVDAKQYSAWVQHKLVLDNRTLGEVAQTIEEIYGYHVVFQEDTLRETKLGGTLDIDNLDQLVEALAIAADLQIVKQEKQLLIRNN
ncbi:ferric-dicitrate binding protein FerR, regulates iron transport through sigma-19 [Catalinimonas alkaloidigena]|uniref:Ferric-dicitrate binding protein FerR, regulates iron transport through sigma-19 n=1 Tax=Catalinimonas alkaloidigena TaxID=1075417 RepID=A0A1G9RGU7_9BACT|nr:FecR domain-containing protein [Catalinimonas alkaloidigena]SDM22423.1 ferric-dicitrate binding protein FerR, regulates iron transport through sigma-19 [Catalinimonas alkaloidigena]